MPWFPLMMFGLALASWRFTQNHADDVGRLLGGVSSFAFLIIALLKTPFFLQAIMLGGLLFFPTCSGGDRTLKPSCPRFCIHRRQCERPPETSFH
ncbi:MAG: hypothetical protein AAFY26_16520 [Cyanobacteria bacterium J06638_22]